VSDSGYRQKPGAAAQAEPAVEEEPRGPARHDADRAWPLRDPMRGVRWERAQAQTRIQRSMKVWRSPIAGATKPKIFRKTEADAEKEAKALETRDGGHSLGRHGPGVSDEQLQERITKGVAADGAFSPVGAGGMSTKFASHQEYMATRDAAEAAADAAVGASKGLMAPLTAAWATAAAEFIKEKPGKDKAVKQAAMQAAKGKVDSAAKGIPNPSTDKLSVTVQSPIVKSSTTEADLPALVAGMVRVRASYELVLDHKRPVGSGFQGDGPAITVTDPNHKDPTKPAKTGEGNAKTKAMKPPTKTRTTFDVTGGAQPIDTVPAAKGWKAAQHFPTEAPTGISY
jgi:hypothetical protein